ncbi:hypothetical protein BO71DRAFT_28656 [Aspergillus ellipticus CBS 707.79]|uniref:Uncharacterized protein n=1 Tax=Aspergillus ellipticus CBS 707.79 TaxID=1448320 RepID=A0A319D443_9EURO|nr:hypothetical protein BO71DRAFT_28656 [Aspergillus ellipticus CBS 707.79]
MTPPEHTVYTSSSHPKMANFRDETRQLPGLYHDASLYKGSSVSLILPVIIITYCYSPVGISSHGTSASLTTVYSHHTIPARLRYSAPSMQSNYGMIQEAYPPCCKLSMSSESHLPSSLEKLQQVMLLNAHSDTSSTHLYSLLPKPVELSSLHCNILPAISLMMIE